MPIPCDNPVRVSIHSASKEFVIGRIFLNNRKTRFHMDPTGPFLDLIEQGIGFFDGQTKKRTTGNGRVFLKDIFREQPEESLFQEKIYKAVQPP